MNKERQDKRAEKRFATRQKKAAKDKERQRKEEERKVELAKRIARQSQHMQATYKRFENAMMRCLRWCGRSKRGMEKVRGLTAKAG